MKTSPRILAFLLVVSFIIFSPKSSFASGQVKELNVSAAASLKDVLLEIKNHYLQKQPNIKINFSFGSSGALQNQIEQGAPVDLFVAAASKQMDVLEMKGLLAKGIRKNLLENNLVMIVPKDSTLNLKDFNDLALDSVKKIGIGAPESVPAGQYAQQVFHYLNLTEKIQSKTVLGTDVRAVLAYVETGNVDAGIVYRTDALISDKVKIVATAPAGSHDRIVYPVAILTNAAHPKVAAVFLAYLTGREGQTIFKKYGFITN